MQVHSVITTAVLALLGAAMWTHGGTGLAQGRALHSTPNPLGIKMSPYGQVLAMAIQAPIDSDWHARLARPHSAESCTDPDCSNHGGGKSDAPKGLLARLEEAVTERTNPHAITRAHDFYLRRQVEKRLRFAWTLDPSNYANYHAYHLFLSESSVGTLDALRENWIQHGLGVARFTIGYSLKEEHDPRPALTAAVAAANAMELMLTRKEDAHPAELRQMLDTMDAALAKHVRLSNAWVESGAWDAISPIRQQEIADRYTFLTKIRDANAKAVERMEAEPSSRAETPTSSPGHTVAN